MEIEHLLTLSKVQCHDKRLHEQYIKRPSVERKFKTSYKTCYTTNVQFRFKKSINGISITTHWIWQSAYGRFRHSWRSLCWRRIPNQPNHQRTWKEYTGTWYFFAIILPVKTAPNSLRLLSANPTRIGILDGFHALIHPVSIIQLDSAREGTWTGTTRNHISQQRSSDSVPWMKSHEFVNMISKSWTLLRWIRCQWNDYWLETRTLNYRLWVARTLLKRIRCQCNGLLTWDSHYEI